MQQDEELAFHMMRNVQRKQSADLTFPKIKREKYLISRLTTRKTNQFILFDAGWNDIKLSRI